MNNAGITFITRVEFQTEGGPYRRQAQFPRNANSRPEASLSVFVTPQIQTKTDDAFGYGYARF